MNVENAINVTFGSADPVERALSNLDEAPFELDGAYYRSVESFWQGLYFPQEERQMIAHLKGLTAKKMGGVRDGQTHLTYQEREIKIGSFEHQILMFRSLKAKFDQNEKHRMLLLETDNRELTHVLKRKDGTVIPDSTTIPAHVFTKFLRILRKHYHISSQVQRINDEVNRQYFYEE